MQAECSIIKLSFPFLRVRFTKKRDGSQVGVYEPAVYKYLGIRFDSHIYGYECAAAAFPRPNAGCIPHDTYRLQLLKSFIHFNTIEPIC